MRKPWIWLMLVLLPMRLWAGAVMPAHHPASWPTVPAASAPLPVECHTRMDPAHSHDHTQASHALPTDQFPATAPLTQADCHEGPACSLCNVCHSPAGLLSVWSPPASQVHHTLPNTPAAAGHAHDWPPLIKPPIA